MKKKLAVILLGGVLASCGSGKIQNDLAESTPIYSQIDLTKVDNDRVPVIINPGRFSRDTVTYRLPKVVQGTYSVSDFGKYIDDLKAIDYDGNEMTIEKQDTNTWMIIGATKLDKITYLVNDTFDQEAIGGIGGEVPFSPSGTNIEEDNYVLNLHGFIGYFDSLKNSQYTLDVNAPAHFERTSALQVVDTKISEDGKAMISSYFAPRYFDITDNPMMYGNLDVESFKVGDIKIVLSVYSPNKVHSAASIKSTVYKMMEAQKAYLGDINSTPRYDIYLYLSDGSEGMPKGFGALEHHTSTVVVLREKSSEEELAASMIDVVAHEFFHIVTPLSVHSEDIHYFDYNKPTFSKHLWMYEGVTEYFAQHFQVYKGMIDANEFYNNVMGKISISQQLDDRMSFTKMSENILEEPYASNYYNVYQKGALIGMCIDILMREESNGQRSMLSLMKELSLKYGKNKPFVDDDIIAEITAMTYPSIGEFLTMHVQGTTPIDYNVFFAKAGLILTEDRVETNYLQNAGSLIISGSQATGTLFFSDAVKKNSFWNDQGVLPNDIIKVIEGEAVTLENANEVLGKVFAWKPGKEVEVKLERAGVDVIIKTTLTQSYTTGKVLKSDDNASKEQLELRSAWLNISSQ